MVPTEPFQIDADIFDVFNTRLRTEPTGGVSFKPFELDPFMQEDPEEQEVVDDPVVVEEPDDVVDPVETFDWPIEDDTPVVPDCTPLNADYPNCLL